MAALSSRDIILQKLSAAKQGRKELTITTPENSSDSAVFKPILPNLKECFRAELEAVSGVCFICKTQQEVVEQIRQILQEQQSDTLFTRDKTILTLLKENDIPATDSDEAFIDMKVGITACEFLIARTGSIMVSSAGDSGRQMNIYPPIHIILAQSNQLVEYPSDALLAIQQKYNNDLPSIVSLISGPSRTADIEKTLVLGAHGPKALYVILYEQ